MSSFMLCTVILFRRVNACSSYLVPDKVWSVLLSFLLSDFNLCFKPRKSSCFVVVLECNVYILTHFFHIIAYTDTLTTFVFIRESKAFTAEGRWIFVGRCIDCSDMARQWRHMTLRVSWEHVLQTGNGGWGELQN